MSRQGLFLKHSFFIDYIYQLTVVDKKLYSPPLVVKDTALLCVGHGLAGGAGLVAEEGHLQGVAVGVLVHTAPQGPATQQVYMNQV